MLKALSSIRLCSKKIQRQVLSNTLLLGGLDISLKWMLGETLTPKSLKQCCDYFYFLQDKQLTFQLLLFWARSEPREGLKISLEDMIKSSWLAGGVP